MAHKLLRMQRADVDPVPVKRPVMLGIAGDSGAGKTTLAKGLVEALGPERSTSICLDDYHRYDRRERRELPFSIVHPEGNYLGIIEQHLQLLAIGQPILKPVYDHDTGRLIRPEPVVPRDFLIVEGLLPLHTKLTRACFDVTVYLDPPPGVRREWKIERDTRLRGYTAAEVAAEMQRQEADAEAFVRAQRTYADIVVRFGPIPGRHDAPGTPLSAELLLRPTIRHPDLSGILSQGDWRAMHLKLARDEDGRPVDALHVHGYAPREESMAVEKAIAAQLGVQAGDPPETLGRTDTGERNEPLAITQLLLLYHLLEASR